MKFLQISILVGILAMAQLSIADTPDCTKLYVQQPGTALRAESTETAALVMKLAINSEVCWRANVSGWTKVSPLDNPNIEGWVMQTLATANRVTEDEWLSRARNAIKNKNKEEAIQSAEIAAHINSRVGVLEVLVEAYKLSDQKDKIHEIQAMIPKQNESPVLFVPATTKGVEKDQSEFAKQEWMGLQRSCHWLPVKLSEKKVKSMPYSETKEVDGSVLTPNLPELVFAVNKKLGLTAPIKCGVVSGTKIEFAGKQYEFHVPHYRSDNHCLKAGLIDIDILRDGKVENSWKKNLCAIEPSGLAGGASELLWAGDLDGDNKLDVLLKLPDHPAAGSYLLLLSSRPGTHLLYQYSEVGNPGC